MSARQPGQESLVTAIRLYLALLWLRCCLFLVRILRTNGLKPVNQYFHKVVVIGDDFAAGVGDYVILGSKGGLAEHLLPIISRSDKVRHQWEIINAGVPGSHSGDWLVNSQRKLFDRVFNNERISDAEIVIILLGSNEFRISSSVKVQDIKKNLTSLCDTLRKKGKQVCLATIASPAPLQQEAEKLPLNSMLEEFAKSTSDDDIPVVLGPRLDTFALRRENALSFDSYHLNSNGYKILARNSADFLIPMLTAVEWKTWKSQLQHVTYDKTLYE